MRVKFKNPGKVARYRGSLSNLLSFFVDYDMLFLLSHQSLATMAASAMLSIGAGAGTEFISEFRQLGRVESKFCERPRKLFRCSCMNGHNFPHKCIWRIPRTRNFIFKSRDSSLVLAFGKEVKDSFLYSLSLSRYLHFGLFWFWLL